MYVRAPIATIDATCNESVYRPESRTFPKQYRKEPGESGKVDPLLRLKINTPSLENRKYLVAYRRGLSLVHWTKDGLEHIRHVIVAATLFACEKKATPPPRGFESPDTISEARTHNQPPTKLQGKSQHTYTHVCDYFPRPSSRLRCTDCRPVLWFNLCRGVKGASSSSLFKRPTTPSSTASRTPPGAWTWRKKIRNFCPETRESYTDETTRQSLLS